MGAVPRPSPRHSDAKLNFARRPGACNFSESTWSGGVTAGWLLRKRKTSRADVEELRLVECVDQVRPDLETRTTHYGQGLRQCEVPLIPAGQAEWRDGRRPVLSRRWCHECCRVEPEQTILPAGGRVSDLIGPQRIIWLTPELGIIAVGDLDSNGRT